MRLKGVFAMLVICLWLLGTIGGVGYLVYHHAWVISAGVLANSILAFFKVKNMYKESFNE